MEKQKIIFYLDWTDCIAHLTGDDSYTEGETEEEKSAYARNQQTRFFDALKQLQRKYDVEIHCITGGTIEYLNGLDGGGWVDQLNELFINEVGPGVFKSVVTEYGCDMLVFNEKETKIVKRPFEDSKVLCTEKLCDSINAVIPKEVKDKVETSLCNYYGNIRFLDENMTDEQFEYYYAIISDFNGHENYTLYPYYFPGYGVEIDVLPNGIDKGRGVDSINEYFYSKTPKEQVALSVFNGDFPEGIDLLMINHSLTNDVVYVASLYAKEYQEKLDKTTLPHSIGEVKIASVSKLMEDLVNMDLTQHPYDKGDYKYAGK